MYLITGSGRLVSKGGKKKTGSEQDGDFYSKLKCILDCC